MFLYTFKLVKVKCVSQQNTEQVNGLEYFSRAVYMQYMPFLFFPAQTFPPSFINAEQCEARVPAVRQTYSTQHGDIRIHSLTHRHMLIPTI